MAAEKKETAAAEEFNIDEALGRLDEINDSLADEGITLKESMELYKEGALLAAKCREHLVGVEEELKIINDSISES